MILTKYDRISKKASKESPQNGTLTSLISSSRIWIKRTRIRCGKTSLRERRATRIVRMMIDLIEWRRGLYIAGCVWGSGHGMALAFLLLLLLFLDYGAGWMDDC